jgi:KDO2-lipid IV(A) lauroyltransferase
LGKILFHIFVIPVFYFISIWPFWLLQFFSYILYIFVYHLFGYRKAVVKDNLKKSFTAKSESELKEIEKSFYLHFCDLIFETIKLLTISKESFQKHFIFDETATRTFRHFEEKRQSIVGVLGHCGNWEWAGISYSIYFKHVLTAVYHPLSDKNFDSLLLKMRTRYGANIVAMREAYRQLMNLRDKEVPTVIGLIADQTPPPESAYWTTFLNQDTPVFNGTEKIARKFNYPVIYVPVKKLRRGYYEMSAVTITENPVDLPEGMITELHTRELEKNIISQPHIWLWSHRRWKHRKPGTGN